MDEFVQMDCCPITGFPINTKKGGNTTVTRMGPEKKTQRTKDFEEYVKEGKGINGNQPEDKSVIG